MIAIQPAVKPWYDKHPVYGRLKRRVRPHGRRFGAISMIGKKLGNLETTLICSTSSTESGWSRLNVFHKGRCSDQPRGSRIRRQNSPSCLFLKTRFQSRNSSTHSLNEWNTCSSGCVLFAFLAKSMGAKLKYQLVAALVFAKSDISVNQPLKRIQPGMRAQKPYIRTLQVNIHPKSAMDGKAGSSCGYSLPADPAVVLHMIT